MHKNVSGQTQAQREINRGIKSKNKKLESKKAVYPNNNNSHNQRPTDKLNILAQYDVPNRNKTYKTIYVP